jgi:hypothetical protein
MPPNENEEIVLMTKTPDHLVATSTDRGFKHLPPIAGSYGGQVRVYESSAATHPYIWLNVDEATLHLTVEDATKLAEQLAYLVKNHYQVQTR